MSGRRTVFSEIFTKGTDETFEPKPAKVPTDFRVGSMGRLNTYAVRLMRGEDLFHEDDCKDPPIVEEEDFATMTVCEAYKHRKRLW